jgi:GNAT superfamily N-acetyltransferase
MNMPSLGVRDDDVVSLNVREVLWHHAEAVVLRTAMTDEITPRYADRSVTMPVPPEMATDPRDVVFVAIAYLANRPAGHIALRRLPTAAGLPGRAWPRDGGPPELEIKRMFVAPSARGQGVGHALLAAAERAAVAAGAIRTVLQTGDRQPEAAALYERAGYRRVPIFAPYLGLPYSLCFAKQLTVSPTPGLVTVTPL